nr:PH domain protein [Aspergillus sp.]
MATLVRSQTPVQDAYGSIAHRTGSLRSSRGFSRSNSRPNSIYTTTNPAAAHGALPTRFHEDFDTSSQRASLDDPSIAIPRSVSQLSHSRSATPTRSATGTLKKKNSLNRKGSLRRSGSRRSMRAGSVRSLALGDREKYRVDGTDDQNSAFYIPIPTDGSPTEVLANRFQAWRKVLKDLIIFFKELQKSYETRAKLFLSASNVLNNSAVPPTFLTSGGLSDATEILRDFHRQGYLEADKAAEIENEVVNQLIGLRNDLQKKTKEIRGLSGDFRNSVDKEVEATRKTVRHLHEALGLVDTDPSATSGKGDPFIVRLSVDKQIEKQIEEENYLHRAFLNLENSGRELESIVVSEIQKAYNAYAGILRREADEAYSTAEKLRMGPVSMPHDHEWNSFIATTDELVDPRVPLRDVDTITYPGKDHPAAAEVRSGMLERKSKYLKSYTPGWYVLSPTHLHEFKSADRVAWQTPVMSLYLPEQKLGSHSQPDSTSHKFMLKGRQTGAMHRGHSWVFRAESHETMMAWYEDIESLISKTGEARNAFVRKHVRTVSGTSYRTSSDGVMDEDEADRTPYSPESVVLAHDLHHPRPTSQPREPGGRFPSDVQIDRHLQAPLSPSSGESLADRDLAAAAEVSGRDGDAPRRVQGVLDGGDHGQGKHISYDDESGPRPTAHTIYHAHERDGGNNAQSERDVVARARNGSMSSAPTTNVTDHTHQTVPTSVGSTESGELTPQPNHDADVFSTKTAPAGPSMPNGLVAGGTPATATSNPTAQTPATHSKGSVSALELRIPGHYPPTHVPA